jgi:hypothetical protein
MTAMEKDESYIPKHHIMMHGLHRSAEHGNPKFYATWKSETHNKTLKLCCRQVSQATFETTVLLKMKHVLLGPQKRRHP